jgi:hypothetical protein
VKDFPVRWSSGIWVPDLTSGEWVECEYAQFSRESIGEAKAAMREAIELWIGE